MKKLTILFALFILISCNRDNPNQVAQDAVISPSGVVFAESKSDLTAMVCTIFKRNDIAITTVSFMESKLASSVIVDVETKTGEPLSNVVIARGRISYNAESLIIEDNRDDDRKEASAQDIVVTCEGCANCNVQVTVKPDDTLLFIGLFYTGYVFYSKDDFAQHWYILAMIFCTASLVMASKLIADSYFRKTIEANRKKSAKVEAQREVLAGIEERIFKQFNELLLDKNLKD